MSTNIYTTDGDWINTPVPYNTVRGLLLENKPYIEVSGTQGNSYMIKVDNIACIEQEIAKGKEEKK